MRNNIAVSFDGGERRTLKVTQRWGGLLTGDGKEHLQNVVEWAGVLRTLGERNPAGHSWAILDRARTVLLAIRDVAQAELTQWSAIGETAPEEGEENSIIARPKEAVGIIVTARQTAIDDVDAALELIEAALRCATLPFNEKVEGA